MDEYIRREAVVKEIKSRIYAADDAWESGYNTAMAEIMEWIKHIPSADVQPVKHGRWIIDYAEGTKIYHAHCSECGKEPNNHIGGDYYIDKLSDFCPNCGARMDGDNE
ncbi:MAG: hypothetical protein J6I46_09615 [Ruminococcus sp.]|nr:hypothetical protein [Ruminococcus sp.]